MNDHWAFEMAKANVERYYPVVGILEELNVTLAVLEKKLPYFFKGIQDMYHKQLLRKFATFVSGLHKMIILKNDNNV